MATLAELRTRLDFYVNRDDPDYTDRRTEWLNAGLRWLQRQLSVTPGFVTEWQHQAKVVAGTEEIDLPREYRPSDETRLARFDAGTPSDLRRIPVPWLTEPFWDQERGEQVNLGNTTLRGTPLYFAIWGRTLQIRPPADMTYAIRIEGLRWLAPLVNDDDDNVLTCEAEDACLYAAVGELWLAFEDTGRSDFWRDRARVALREWEADQRIEDRGERPRVMRPPG